MAVREDVRDIVRLLMRRPITERDALAVKATAGFEHLWVTAGEWVGFEAGVDDVTTGEEHGWLEYSLLHFIGNHVVARKLGRLYPGDITFVLDGEPNDIRLFREPDIGFLKAEHVKPTKGFIFRAPDLAVEIISPSQSYDEMVKKAAEYFQYGTQQVWIVLPSTKQIEVRNADGSAHIYRLGDLIDGGDLLPGLLLSVQAVFDL